MLIIRNLQSSRRIVQTSFLRCSKTNECLFKIWENTIQSNFCLNGNSLIQQRPHHLGPVVYKYSKKSSKDMDASDDEDDADFKDERDSKVLKTKVNSLRADLLLRAGLGMARNKVEVVFYESKIRVNGKKLLKKSVQLNVGDEIDVIKGFSQSNPTHLFVARVVVLSANEREEGMSVNLRRYKSLLIDNYAGENAYKSAECAAQ